jgi:hypothetical protein
MLCVIHTTHCGIHLVRLFCNVVAFFEVMKFEAWQDYCKRWILNMDGNGLNLF